MNKLLIGISAPINQASRDAISVFTEEFNLEHINLRQPVINMVAALTNMHPTHQEFCCASHEKIDDLGISIAELELSIAFSLRASNGHFFIVRAQAAIAQSAHGMHNKLFNGYIVSGIKTEAEAQWIRNQGGLVVHLYQYDNTVDFHALNELDSDLVFNISSKNPTRNNLTASIVAIKGHICQNQQVA
jgi:hypothetical protein